MAGKNIDFEQIAQTALGYAETLVQEWLPDGKREGNEWSALNPTRADGKPGSFKVNMQTGMWSDFATEDAGGDLIGLYAYLSGCNQGEAAKAVAERCGVMLEEPKGGQKKTRPASGKNKWTPLLPIPDDAPPPPKAHYTRGAYSKAWVYRDARGRPLGYVCRFDNPDSKGDKVVLPLMFCVNQKGQRDWQFRAFNDPRPLYGLDRLAEKPSAPVLIVEGEKCAEAGARFLPDWAVVSWPGGSKAVGKADWAPLEGRDICIWPDNDKPGVKAALDIYDALLEKASRIMFVTPPHGDKPKGWDIADAICDGWNTDTLSRFMTSHETGSLETNYRLTDTGNAERLIRRFGDKIRFNARPMGKWFLWQRNRWREDDTNKIYEYVDLVVRDLWRDISKCSDPDYKKKMIRHAMELESMGRQRSMISKAETLQSIAIRIDDLDNNHFLFNTMNCTLDLSRGDEVICRAPAQADYITRQAAVVYDRKAECPRWRKFLEEIFAGNEDVIPFMQRTVGYALTGDVSEQKMFFAYGMGANGKSVFFNTMEMLFGDYFGKAPTEMIVQQKFNQIPTDVADLKGKRFVVCSEVEDNRRLAEARVKDLTGGDTIKARRMREDFFDFTPTHKLFLFGNHRLNIRGTDTGTWRRLLEIPFTVTIPPEKRVPMRELLNTFKQELSGILNWALDGYLDYREGGNVSGLREPEAVTRAVKDYREEMDVIGRFLDEYTKELKSANTLGQKLWQVYHGWCDDNGEHAFAARRFFSMLRERGLRVDRGSQNKTFVYDIVLTADAEADFNNKRQ